MRYDPKVLINRTGKKVEFLCGGVQYIYAPGDTAPKGKHQLLPGIAAYHALNLVNTGLEEFTPEVEEEERRKETITMPDYASMSWQSLIKRARKHPEHKRTMMKEEVIKLLEDKWKEKNGKK